MDCILGIDTSNYTTSLCAVALQDGALLAESRKLLPVKTGQRGLRQSDALFFHVQQIPWVMDNLMAQLQGQEHIRWHGIGVSVRPRPLCTSYMPVFHAGRSFAESFGRALGIPVVHASHQEGHMAAAQKWLDMPTDVPFIAVHLSGGTSDVLWAQRTRFGYRVEVIGEGADLHAGQFVDRIGVALGCPFPAGPHLEKLAQKALPDNPFRLPSSRTAAQLSFSGPCSAALRAIEHGVSPENIAFAVEACIANSVVSAVEIALTLHPEVCHLVVAGGVAANTHIRERMEHRMRILTPKLQVHFAPARFASDNALGPADIARRFLLQV